MKRKDEDIIVTISLAELKQLREILHKVRIYCTSTGNAVDMVDVAIAKAMLGESR